ncbi:MAG TPA: hypothetical protein VGB30_14925 [bacterium]|jgi:hydroxymethylpyrimidine pyrophosphatase-like HAD family hydrolase
MTESIKLAIACDIDSTLTPPRLPITKPMADILARLNVPFNVVAGSHLELLNKQFFEPLFEHGYRNQFDAYISNGAIRYRCDYRNELSMEKIYEFIFTDHLGDERYAFLNSALSETLAMDEFQLPDTIRILPNRIVDRRSMINLCPIGRIEVENDVARRNRAIFVEFDRQTGYRKRMMAYLYDKLKIIVAEKHLHITLGGQTSFDIGIAGKDKSMSVRNLVDDGYQKVIFIGDALFEGGNDAVVNEYIAAWSGDTDCPVEAIQVNSYEETIEVIKNLGIVD